MSRSTHACLSQCLTMYACYESVPLWGRVRLLDIFRKWPLWWLWPLTMTITISMAFTGIEWWCQNMVKFRSQDNFHFSSSSSKLTKKATRPQAWLRALSNKILSLAFALRLWLFMATTPAWSFIFPLILKCVLYLYWLILGISDISEPLFCCSMYVLDI